MLNRMTDEQLRELDRQIAERRADREFMERLRTLRERERELLERLGDR